MNTQTKEIAAPGSAWKGTLSHVHAFVRERDLHALKRDAGRVWEEFSHGQACELLAASLGRNTFAALKAELANGHVVTLPDALSVFKRRYLEIKQDAHETVVEMAVERIPDLLGPYACQSTIFDASDTTGSIVAALSGWIGTPLAAFARDFDAEFWPEGPFAPELTDKSVSHFVKRHLGFRRDFSPIAEFHLFSEGTFPAVPGLVLQVRIHKDCVDIGMLYDVIRYLERYARDRAITIAFVGEATMEVGGEAGRGGELKYTLRRTGYADVTGFWVFPVSAKEAGRYREPTMIKSFSGSGR